MHKQLRYVFEKTVELFKADPRVLAAYICGSANSSHEDELSDVDPVFILRPEVFDEFEAELLGIFEGLCDEILMWWPERCNCKGHKNFAILFYAEENLLQYDINIHAVPDKLPIPIEPEQFLFDKAGLLDVRNHPVPERIGNERILWLINAYWIWIYIHAKYLRRRDIVKLDYVQRQLFTIHLELVGVLHETVRRHPWEPLALKTLQDKSLRDTLTSYLLHDSPESVRTKLPRQIERFASFARGLCQTCGLDYPARAESEIRRHLQKAIEPVNP